MARPGVTEEQMHSAISALQMVGKEITVTTLREQLRSGSFSTLSAFLQRWRAEQERRPSVPNLPEGVSNLFRQLWGEAFHAADDLAQAERERYGRERSEWQQEKQEMRVEISRLEQTVQILSTEHEKLKNEAAAQFQELDAVRLQCAKCESARQTIEQELHAARTDKNNAQQALTTWIERATRAETRLEEVRSPPETPERKK